MTAVGLHGLAELLLARVLEPDIDAAQRRLLRDLGAHRARADDGEAPQGRGHCTEKIRVTALSVITLGSRPSTLSLPIKSFAATPLPTPS